MLQVNTFPPHYIFFSKEGIIRLFKKLDYELIQFSNDLDYEIFSLGDRTSQKGIINLFINKILSPLIAILSIILLKNESMIILLRRKKSF